MLYKLACLALVASIAAQTPTVNLGTSADFAILSKSGISTVPQSSITGDIGVSPIAGAAMTGFAMTMEVDLLSSVSTQLTGKAYASDYTSPTPSKLTTAVSDGETAYTDAAGRPTVAANINVGAGLIDTLTFTPGVYAWDRDVSFTSAIEFKGEGVYIFQTTGNVVVGSGAGVTLADGAVASNIFWQVAGFVDAGTGSHLEGNFLIKTHAAFKTGSSLNGRIFAQTAVTLDSATVVKPA